LKDFETIPLEIPGRGKRNREDLLKDFDLAAWDLYGQIVEKLESGDFLIYGHSMGAYLTLRVCGLLEKEKLFPACLVVSGNPGPGIGMEKRRYLLEKAEFIEELMKLGGVSPEVIENEELLDLLLPILRADFEVSERNNLKLEAPVRAPVFAIMGNEEEYVDEIGNWKNYTLSGFNKRILKGDHFFIFRHPQEIAQIIRYSYGKGTLLRYPAS
jgi:surfactin synthase thioesterase subunit